MNASTAPAGPVAVVGRPGEVWQVLEPHDITETGRLYRRRPTHNQPGQVDQGPYLAALAEQLEGRQPGYIARVGLIRMEALA